MDEVDGAKKKDLDIGEKLLIPPPEMGLVVRNGKRVIVVWVCTCLKAVTVKYQLQACN